MRCKPSVRVRMSLPKREAFIECQRVGESPLKERGILHKSKNGKDKEKQTCTDRDSSSAHDNNLFGLACTERKNDFHI